MIIYSLVSKRSMLMLVSSVVVVFNGYEASMIIYSLVSKRSVLMLVSAAVVVFDSKFN